MANILIKGYEMKIFKSVLLLGTLLFAYKQMTMASMPKKGGTFYYNLKSTPTTLNPLSATDGYSSQVHSYTMESLLTRDIDTYEWKPNLAKSWEISKDGMVFTFVLRDGIKFHDGKPMTIEDVKFSFDAVTHPENKYKTAHLKSYYEGIEKAEVVNKNTIKFYAKNKIYKNFDIVAGMLEIVPKHVYESPSKKQEKKLNKTIVGSGPYKFKSLKRGKGVTLVRNKNWWGLKLDEYKNENNFDKIFMRFIKDSTIAIQRLEKGDIDFQALSPEEFEKKATGSNWGKSVFKVKTENKAPAGYTFIGWNLKDRILKSKEVRKALYHLINRPLMIEKFLYGYSVPATGPQYLSSEYANKDVPVTPFDPEKALEILRADGWADTDGDQVLDKVIDGKKEKLSFTILEPNKDFVKYLTIFKEDAKKRGVDIKIKFIEWNSFIKALDERNFEAVRLAWGGGSVDWDPKQIWHSSSIENKGSNFVSYSNEKVDKWIDEARLIHDKSKRKEILNKVYKEIAEDYPYAFLFNTKYTFYGHTKSAKRHQDTYTYGVGIGRWWLEK